LDRLHRPLPAQRRLHVRHDEASGEGGLSPQQP
jgi:hypothetical protein